MVYVIWARMEMDRKQQEWLDREGLKLNRWWESLRWYERMLVTGRRSERGAEDVWGRMERKDRMKSMKRWNARGYGLMSDASMYDGCFVYEHALRSVMSNERGNTLTDWERKEIYGKGLDKEVAERVY